GTGVRRPDLVLRDDQHLPITPTRSSAVVPVVVTIVSVVVVAGAAVGGYFLWTMGEPVPFAGNATPPSVVVR
ncbi:MAG: hypothetical protein WCJ30_12455, partial [Deltaproteobacteria bacterium]